MKRSTYLILIIKLIVLAYINNYKKYNTLDLTDILLFIFIMIMLSYAIKKNENIKL